VPWYFPVADALDDLFHYLLHHVELLEELQADIIVTQALCEVCAVSEAEIEETICQLSNSPKVLNLEPMCLNDVFGTLLLVGKETGQEAVSIDVVDALNTRVERVHALTKAHVQKNQYPKVTFLEWIDPPFNAGHWTPELIEMAGGIDCLVLRISEFISRMVIHILIGQDHAWWIVWK